MNYIDLHCDALTKEGVAVVTAENLQTGGCALQCFAAFIREREGRFARALSLCEKFGEMCRKEGYHPVRKFSDLCAGKINAMLTVEEGGAIEGSLAKLEELYCRGVRMMTLTWNSENEIGAPNIKASGATRETERGLTAFGEDAVARMKSLGMIVDVSHGSDKLVEDVAERMKGTPFVASHSDSAEVFPHPRNLQDGQIRRIADSGGVVGLCFCADFLSADRTPEGQRAALIAHAKHILQVGGEDALALGSDFDGTEPDPYLQDPAAMPRFLEELQKNFGGRTAEKIAYANALRVLQSVLR